MIVGGRSVSVDTSEVDALLRNLDADLRADVLADALLRGGQIVAIEAEVNAPKRTGRLAANIDAEIVLREDAVAEVDVGFVAGSGVAHIGRFQERGVQPHELATGRRAARIVDRGGRMPFHPGHRAQPFLEPALEERAEDAITAMRDEVQRRARALGGG